MYIPEPMFIVFSGLACYGLLCFILELRIWFRQRCCERMPVRIALLFQDNADSVEWLLRRLNTVLTEPERGALAEIMLIDTGSIDDTPAILRRMSREHSLYRPVTIYQEPSRELVKNAIVVDCRENSWMNSLERVRRIVNNIGGEQRTVNGEQRTGNSER